MSVAVLGAGAFGTALALNFAKRGLDVTLWARDTAPLRAARQSPRLPGMTLPGSIRIEDSLEAAAQKADLFVTVPTQQLGGLVTQIEAPLTGQNVIACCKGIDLTTLQGPTALINSIKPNAKAAILTGPSFAADIGAGLPCALTLACSDPQTGTTLQGRYSWERLRLYRATDTVGAELGGALKNVIAIACGACIGQGLGESAKAALMTRGFAEITRFALQQGAQRDTLYGLSGMGDLALTCGSEMSRNYRFGIALGRGDSFDPDTTVEGAKTAGAVARLAQAQNIDMPICAIVDKVVHGQASITEAIAYLLNRPPKEE